MFRHDFKLTNLNSNIKKQSSSATNVQSNNLPFMGHLTLNLQKPRRGRKPKSTNISNMIYKNYGIVMPSQLFNEPPSDKAEDQRQEIKEEQPLNLCVREVTGNQKSRPIRRNTPAESDQHVLQSENGVRMSKFKFVNGFLHEKTVYSVDKKGNTSTTDVKARKNSKIEKTKKVTKVEKKIPKLVPNFEEIKSRGDKGILIKTQEQLTANASFAKFRHLKKFTRYLLKNWKIPMQDVTQEVK